MDCWSCQSEVGSREAFCAACGAIQPPDPSEDHFSLLGMPRRYALDPAELERRFRDLSRRLHPDRFARAAPRERRLSLERATRLNDAHRVLRDSRRRAEYLLRLAGADALAGGGAADPAFLEEQLALREALAEARGAGDGEAGLRLAAEARARLGRAEQEIAALFAEQELGRERLAEIARRLARARFDEQLAAEAEGGPAPAGARGGP